MQNQPDGLRLFYNPIPLNPEYAISRAGDTTHSPDTTLTFLHYHDVLEVGYCYEGSGVFLIDNRMIPFSAGCVSIIFKHEIHIAQSSAEHGSKWKFLYLDPMLLLGSLFPDAAWLMELGDKDFGGIIQPADGIGLADVVKELIEESKNRDPVGEQAVKGLVLCMLAKLSRLMPKRAADMKYPWQGYIKSISAALDYIIKNHAQPIYIAELAAACGMSVTTFRRVFSRAIGFAPNEYIQNLRIQLAMMQLHYSQLPVVDISLSVGFDSLSSFNRHFKSRLGMSPSQYRRTIRLNEYCG
jgi:AraC-like DNA-binding protein